MRKKMCHFNGGHEMKNKTHESTICCIACDVYVILRYAYSMLYASSATALSLTIAGQPYDERQLMLKNYDPRLRKRCKRNAQSTSSRRLDFVTGV